MKSPLAFIIFNRLEPTKIVFEVIKKAKPPILFLISDGPRNEKDTKLCEETRKIVAKINWRCKVYKNYSKKNLGCRDRVASGLHWIFSKVDRCVILEDDCVPNLSFFKYCDELLERYEKDERVTTISGDNFQFGRYKPRHSYYFSKYHHLWGWATWKRAFEHYDVNIKLWPQVKKQRLLKTFLERPREFRYWTKIFDKMYRKEIDTWDYQWIFSCWLQNGLCILPRTNLVTNIGFNEQATHTKFKTKFSVIPSKSLALPLKHPPYIIRDKNADDFTNKLFSKPSLLIDYIKFRLWNFLQHSTES